MAVGAVQVATTQEFHNIQAMQGTITDIFNQLSQQIANSQPVAIRQIRDENGKLIGGVRVMADGTETNISF